MDFEQQFGIKLSVLLAGLIGGVVSLTYETKITFYRALLLIVSGASVAAYLQPLAEHWMNLPEKFSTALGFILGLVSMKVIHFIMQYTEGTLQKHLKDDGRNTKDTKSDSGDK
jgi:fructose-specific phosphotransferase system IIC component